jgi:DNA-directed RNA polymerase specialized sigma24 family protein
VPIAPRSSLVQLTDIELTERFQAGSEDALQVLLDRYRRFARARARSYFLVGADGDDVEQEALIGLYVDGRSYQEIGAQLGRHAKSIDNAVQRIKRKVELTLVERQRADREDELALSA